MLNIEIIEADFRTLGKNQKYFGDKDKVIVAVKGNFDVMAKANRNEIDRPFCTRFPKQIKSTQRS